MAKKRQNAEYATYSEIEEEKAQDPDLELSDIGGIDDIGLDAGLFQIDDDSEKAPDQETRYVKPRVRPAQQEHEGIFESAQELARQLKMYNGDRYDCLISGDFIFGDFIEAFLTSWNARAETMTISTLSLNQNNVDSLATLMQLGYIGKLNLIVSTYFYGHEAHSLIPYIYRNLDIADRFQLAVADIHTKITYFESAGGKKIIIHGSANLRSCGAMEQFTIEENPELYDFYAGVHDRIVEHYATIKKAVRASSLWDVITTKTFNK